MRGFGQVGERAEPLDHRVQVGRFLAGDDLRARGRKRDLVGCPVLDPRDADDDHEHGYERELHEDEQHDRKTDVEQPEQAAREEHPDREPGVAPVGLPLHGSHGNEAR